jgi:4-amino-4-deoxy-L-arabinose transferase-like glycosyltransferase
MAVYAARIPTLLVALSVLAGAATTGYNLFGYPLYVTDEGIYMQQAWSVLREARLSPYTYFYDHAPAGWLVVAGWAALLPGQLQTFGGAINTGRALMLVVHLASVFLLFQVARRLSGSLVAAVVSTFLFNVSPLAVFYQRQMLLDNLVVFWVLLSLYLGTATTARQSRAAPDRTRTPIRLVTAIGSGAAFGVAVLTKENTVFFLPALLYLLYSRLRGAVSFRFGVGFWCFSSASIVSMYFLYATLKNELFPSGFSFDLSSPPADHVSLLYTIWWQMNRSQGSLLDTSSPVWRFSLGAWLPKDMFLLAAGGAAMVVNLVLALALRAPMRRGLLVVVLLASGYTFYLARGSQMLEFYVVPLVPFLALNIGMTLGLLVEKLPHQLPLVVRLLPVAALFTVLSLHPRLGYVLVVDEFGKVVTHDLYKLNMTESQAEQVAFIRKNVPPDSKLVIDDDIWADLHDVRPYYKWAHSYTKAARDPDVRDKLFGKDWRNIDYIVLSNKMRDAMALDNADGSVNWIFDALNRGQDVWVEQRGDVHLAVVRVVR